MRKERLFFDEIIINHRLVTIFGFYHPNRESNDSIIEDAKLMDDFKKAIEEQRHEIAMNCVLLGIYKDVAEAKRGIL